MHELSLTRSIVEIVEQAAQGRPVARVTIEVGRLAGVASEALAFCFEVVAAGGCAEGAALEVREIEGRARCLACDAEFNAESLHDPCPCGSRRLVRLQGEELAVKSIEVREAA